MNAFDASVLSAFNRFAGTWPGFDRFVAWVSGAPVVKGCVVAAVIWALWWSTPTAGPGERRPVILATMAGALVAEFAARILALALPFRARPLHDPDLRFTLPEGFGREVLEGWSAFPSDHAVLFFALATGIVHASRKAGVALLLFTVVVICLPRIYLGLHHPTDILGGAVLGIGFGLLFQARALREQLARPFLTWEATAPLTFYAFAWYFTYEVARMFEDFRFVLKVTAHALRG